MLVEVEEEVSNFRYSSLGLKPKKLFEWFELTQTAGNHFYSKLRAKLSKFRPKNINFRKS
jgi:hypothetical protein